MADFRASLEAQSRLLSRGCRGDHPGPEHRAELDRGQAHAPGGPEHHGPLPRLDPGHAAQRVVRRGMGHPRRGRGAQFDPRVDGPQRPGRHGDLLGEGAEHRRPHDPVTDGDALDARARPP